MKIKLKGKLFDHKDFSNVELANATTEMVANKVWLNGKPLNFKKSLKIRSHSPTGFVWGYSGIGPLQLGLSICLELFDREVALKIYQTFNSEFISPLPNTDFEKEIDLSDFIKDFMVEFTLHPSPNKKNENLTSKRLKSDDNVLG